MLCMPLMETRSNNRMLVRNRFLRSAVEMVFGRQIVMPQENTAVACAPHGSRGPTTIVGSFCVYRDQKRKQRETRKTCVVCGHPVCSEHSVSKRFAALVEMNELFLLCSFLHYVNKLINLYCLNKITLSFKNQD